MDNERRGSEKLIWTFDSGELKGEFTETDLQ